MEALKTAAQEHLVVAPGLRDWLVAGPFMDNPYDVANHATILETIRKDCSVKAAKPYECSESGLMYVLIDPEDQEACDLAQELLEQIEDEGCLDEYRVNEIMGQKIDELWEAMSFGDRLILLADVASDDLVQAFSGIPPDEAHEVLYTEIMETSF